MKLIVVAGGQGTKMWPMSRERLPKQFQPVVGEKTLFRLNIEALLRGFPAEDILVSTKKQYATLVHQEFPELIAQNLILEPDIKKNQGPATLLAALKTAQLYPEEPFMIIQSDCIRLPEEEYIEMIKQADQLVRRDRRLITGGIRPTYPDMGSDYMQLGDKIDLDTELEVYKIDKFVPRLGDYAKTKELIENFHVSTHCNHHCWFADQLLDACKDLRPNWYEKFSEIKQILGTPNEESEIERIYAEVEAGPIEDVTKYIFEREGNVILLPFKWTDIGTWGSLYSYFAKEKDATYQDGKVISLDTKSSLVKGRQDKLIATLGVKDLVIVDTEDALLVVAKDRIGDMKLIFDELDKQGLSEYL